MIEHGLLDEDEHLELVDGEILTMTPQNSLHAGTITVVADVLRVAFGQRRSVRIRSPLALDEMSEPEPDLAVVEGSGRDYLAAHPESALLVVEVADTTLRYARGRKASLYARAGIAEYWIVTLADRVLEVHRDPTPDAAAALGHAYGTIERLAPGSFVSPLGAPEARIPVSELLP
jgi:Uma2 family endonuclease